MGFTNLHTLARALNRAVELNNGSSHQQILYDAQGAKLAYMSAQTVQKYILPLANGVQAVFNSSGISYYRHADWLGSSRLALYTTGSLYADQAYAPYGETYAETSTTDRSFTGQTQDTTAGSQGVYDFLLRQQSAAQGRWLAPDPAGLAAVDIAKPQTWNRYAYVGNNPLSTVDPLGLCGEEYWDGASNTLSTVVCPFAPLDPTSGQGNPVNQIDPGGGAGGGRRGNAGAISTQAVQNILKKVCGSLPSGSVQGVSGAVGYLGAPTGSVDLVTNFQTGQVSAFTAGGISAGWNNGGLSGAAYSGYVTGLNGKNTNYSGGFTSGTLSAGIPLPNAGVQVTGSSSSGGLTGTPQQMLPNGQVNSLTFGVNAGLIAPPVSVTGAVTNYSNPIQLGKYWTLLAHPVDAAVFAATQICKAAGF